MRLNTIICSYLFFALFIFNTLALLSAEFLPIFSQVFMLLAQDGRIYDIFSCVFIVIAFLMVIIVAIRVYKKKTILGKTAPTMVVLVALLVLSGFAYLFQWLCQKFFIAENVVFIEQNNHLSTWQSYYTSVEFVVAFCCCFFLVVIPLLCRVIQLHSTLENRIARSLYILKPSITTIVIIMSANAFHPYFSDLPSRIMQFSFFIVAGYLFLYLLMHDKLHLSIYEYVNVCIFVFMILCFVLCSESILRSNFFNAQLTFYMLGLFSWCSEWIYNEEVLGNQLA